MQLNKQTKTQATQDGPEHHEHQGVAYCKCYPINFIEHLVSQLNMWRTKFCCSSY
jgi:hypothetical protein